jgi:hypothetical protein
VLPKDCASQARIKHTPRDYAFLNIKAGCKRRCGRHSGMTAFASLDNGTCSP